jgi:molecular chaperone DnaJ
MGLGLDDAYVELGVSPGASESEVKAAWRRLVSRWHPDRNASADAAALMQRINRAYDRIRLAFVEPAGHPAPAATSGPVVHRRVRLSVEQAALGVTRVLRGKLIHHCAGCDGEGILRTTAKCPTCDGAGTTRSPMWFGWVSSREACSTCDGSGTVRESCTACDGRGHAIQRYRRSVRFPAGVRAGEVLTIDGAGPGAGGFDGSLEMAVELTPHSFFTLDDHGTLRCQMPVDGFAWLAEAWIDVPTLGGLQHMRLRRNRHVYRLRGQGWPLDHDGTERGDQIVTVVPTFPDQPAPGQLALLEQLVALASPQDAKATREWDTRLRAWATRPPTA